MRKENRPFTYRYLSNQPGRVTIAIACPFCGAETVAYTWALVGGKRCECGAVFTWSPRNASRAAE